MNILRILTLSLLAISALVAQTVPLSISYQAVLTNEEGNLLSPDQPTNHNVQFRIYDSAQAGTLIWAEAQTVSVFKGEFSTLLGTGDPIGSDPRPALDAVFNQAERYLEITLLGGTSPETFSPRQQLISTPYSFRSSTADVAQTIVDGVVGTTKLASSSVTEAKLSANAVTTSKVADQSIVADKVATGAIGSTQLQDGGVNLDDLASAIMERLIPAGSVIAWSGHSESRTINDVSVNGLPNGWMLCQGQIVPKTQFPELFAAIGHTYSLAGDDILGTGFRLPDYRGMFLRGQADDASQDPDIASRSVKPWLVSAGIKEASSQADEFKSHNHSDGEFERILRLDNRQGNSPEGANSINHATEPDVLNSRVLQPAGGAETRPKNTYIHYIIKAH